MKTLSPKSRKYSLNIPLALSASLLTACGSEAMGAQSDPSLTSASMLPTQASTLVAENQINYSAENSSLLNDELPATTNIENIDVYSTIALTDGTTATESTDSATTSSKSKPKIWLSFSKAGNTFSKGTKLTITAKASDSDGKIMRVGFYENGKWVAKDTKAPYTFNWTGNKVGTHYIYAKTTDNDGLTTRTTRHAITITDKAVNKKPTVALTAPTANTEIEADSTITLSAKAFDNDGSISKVAFFANGSWLGKDTSAPYTFDWKNVPEGNHTIYAVATDNKFAMSNSTAVKISAIEVAEPVPPVVELVSPTSSSSVDEGTKITVKANAYDDDGSIKKVAFYSDGKVIGTDWSAPYSLTWDSATVGNHKIYAVATDNDGLTTNSDNAKITVEEIAEGDLVTYPVPNIITALHKSDQFAVKVTQGSKTKNSFVYASENTSSPSWDGTLDYMQDSNHWTTFSFDGTVSVEARRLDDQSISTCVVRPLALNIKPEITGNKCTFSLSEQAQVSVEIDENDQITQPINGMGTITKEIVKTPLFVFAEPMETNVPTKSGNGVVYFGPGIHEIGKGYTIEDNTEVYIAGGAYVIGTFNTNKNPTNVKIRGRGILSGKGMNESNSEHYTWGNHAIDFSSGSKGSGLEIEGITITDPLRSCIVSYNPVDIRNIKLLSWDHRNDGIVAGNYSTIEDSFLKVQDDNLKLYYSNQIIRDTVIWQQTSGAVFKFAWNLKNVAQNNLIEDIDVIHSDVFSDYASTESDRSDLHSANAIFSSMGYQEGAAFKNNTFSNIRIEEKHLLRLMSLRMVSTHKTPMATSVWGDDDVNAKKTIHNILIDGISLAGVPYKKSTMYGNAGGTISKVWFNNMNINGKAINNASSFSSRIDGSGLFTVGNVSNIGIKNSK